MTGVSVVITGFVVKATFDCFALIIVTSQQPTLIGNSYFVSNFFLLNKLFIYQINEKFESQV